MVETRYICADYRSEFSAFYSKAFERFHDSCRRLHFFAADLTDADVLALSEQQVKAYVGYVVLRPQVTASVGRTMLRPPPASGVRTAVRETVGFFGQPLQVRAVPFMQQDARLGSCAHVAIWMCHYSAHRGERRVARLPVADFSLLADPSLGIGRTVPSQGLTLHQISDVLSRSGLAPVYYDAAALTDDDRPAGGGWLRKPGDPADRIARTCCRYLNSGVPVLAVVRHVKGVTTPGSADYAAGTLHAIVVCGYRRDGDHVVLVAHDDRRGPYLDHADVTGDLDSEWNEHSRWEHLLAPVPEKVWLSGESAERVGSETLVAASREAAARGVTPAGTVAAKFQDGDLSFRAYAIDASRFKRRFAGHVADPTVLSAYRGTRMPHYVWVVEAINRPARQADGAGSACVMAEAVYDATSDDRDPRLLAMRLPGIVYVHRPDYPDWDATTGLVASVVSSGQYDP